MREHRERACQRGRNGQRECAGAGDDEHGKRRGKRTRRIDDQPRDSRDYRDHEQGADEMAGGAIAVTRPARPLLLRTPDQAHDCRQCSFGADTRHAHLRRTVDDDAAGDQAFAALTQQRL